MLSVNLFESFLKTLIAIDLKVSRTIKSVRLKMEILYDRIIIICAINCRLQDYKLRKV